MRGIGAIMALARLLAILGGGVLLALMAVTGLSVLGRALSDLLNAPVLLTHAPDLAAALRATGIGPITGDYELVELGLPVAIFLFLPWCHLTLGHARVDLFLSGPPGWAKRALQLGIDTVFALALLLIAWQLSQGAIARMATGQTSYLLQIPVWIPQMAAAFGAWMGALAGLALCVARLLELRRGTDLLPQSEEPSA